MADEQCCFEDDKFPLFLSNNNVFVWDKDVVLTLRRKYRIVGSLVGALPSNPRQNLVFSLPLVLQAEEAKLLLEKNIARLVVNDSAKSCPIHETVNVFRDERKANIEKQVEKLKEIRKQKLEEFAEVIEEAKGLKRKKFKSCKRKTRSDTEEDAMKKQRCEDEKSEEYDDTQDRIEKMAVNDKICRIDIEEDHISYCTSSETKTKNQELEVDDESNNINDTEGRENNSISNETEKLVSKDTSASVGTKTPLESDNEENLEDATLVCVTNQQRPAIRSSKEAKWSFPETETEQLRYKVFADLWEKGYYISGGSKFAGDFLVYPGDPFRFHSYFVVTIVPWKKSIQSLDLVSIGRLGSTVKKTSVLASVDSSGNVKYSSIQWPGFT